MIGARNWWGLLLLVGGLLAAEPEYVAGGECGCGLERSYCRTCCAAHCPHSHCGHRHCHHGHKVEPPRGVVVPSMAAPLLVASPVAFAAPAAFPSFAPAPQPTIRPEALRALASYLESQEKPLATPLCNGGQLGALGAPQVPADAALADQVSELQARIAEIDRRVSAMDASTQRLLERVGAVLDKLQ